MSVDGVWKVEMLGPYGWEPRATAFLEEGRYLASSANHYAIGRYRTKGKSFSAAVRIMQFGEIRTVFGSKKKYVDIQIAGKIKKAEKITGTASPTDGGKFDINVRLTRLGGLG